MVRLSKLFLSACATFSAIGVTAAKTPGHEYCFHGTCHRVKTLEETRQLVGITTKLKASYYDAAGHDAYNPSNVTSSGEMFHPSRPDNAASPIYPDGTKLLVWHPDSRKALVIRVNNAGPYWGDRKLDLSRAAAETFGFTGRGVATVHVQVLEAPTKAEATYRRGRSYPSVKGYVGKYATLDTALANVNGRSPIVVASATQPPKPTVPTAAPESSPTPASPVVVASAAPVATAKMVRLAVARAPAKPAAPTLLDLRVANTAKAEAEKYLVASSR